MMKPNFPTGLIKWLLAAGVFAIAMWLAWLLTLASGCVDARQDADAIRFGLRDGLREGIATGMKDATGVATEKLPVVIETAIDKALDRFVPEPSKLPEGTEAVAGALLALGLRSLDHWRKGKKGNGA